MSDAMAGFIFVIFLVSACLFGFALHAFFISYEMEAYQSHLDLIAECEKELPRNQHCKLVAVIDDTKE